MAKAHANGIRFLLVCLLGAISSVSWAQTTVYAISNVAALRAGNFASFPNLRLNGWYNPGDGGEGDLVAVPSDTTSADNSCTIYVDGAGNRFYRLMQGNPRNAISFYQCGAHGDGVTSDTAAISAAFAAAGTVGAPTGTTYARVFCPAGVFLTSGNIIPAGQRIELLGEHVAGVAGCEIKASSTSVNILTVNADTFKMEDVWLFGGNAAGSGSCLVLGSSALQLNDTTISNSWISNCSNAGIQIINGQGIFINNTTIEVAYTYGILANVGGTSGIAENVTINGSTFFDDQTAISITGSASGDSSNAANWNIVGGTEFNDNASAGTCSVNIQDAYAIHFSGDRFDSSQNHDICGSALSNLSVVGNTWNKGGGAAVRCSGCSASLVTGNTGGQMWLGYSVGFPSSAIFLFTSSSNGNVVTQNLFSCASPHAQFGLSTDSTSNNTGRGPNLFSCQTTNAYNVLGTTAWSY
jgi:Pectate lyase superfamily protein